MTPIELMNDVQARLMGFALAVRDLHDINMDMPYTDIVDNLVAYAKEYEAARNKYYATAN